MAWDRYAYAKGNPIRYVDPSGHDGIDVVGEFATGMIYELGLNTPWATSPGSDVLQVSYSESDARLLGRMAGDILSIQLGVDYAVGGIGTAVAGVVSCGTGVLCPVGVAAVTAGGVVAGAGSIAIVKAFGNFNRNLSLFSEKRSPHANQRAAEGRPTGSAWHDAQNAGLNNVFVDSDTGYYIVRGEKGRAHVFKVIDGKLQLHTSIDTSAKNTFDRIESGKWQYISPDQYSIWQSQLKSTLSE